MLGFEVPQQKWAPYLYGALNDDSRRAVSGLEGEEAQDYASLRKLLLEYYCVKRSTYREKMDTSSKQPVEKWTSYGKRLDHWSRRWTEGCNADQTRSLYNMEIALAAMPAWVSSWVREQQPESLDKATTLADVHIDARTASRDQSRLPAGRRSDNYQEKTSHQRRDEHSRQETSNRSFSVAEKRGKSESKKESEETNKRLPRFDPVKGPVASIATGSDIWLQRVQTKYIKLIWQKNAAVLDSGQEELANMRQQPCVLTQELLYQLFTGSSFRMKSWPVDKWRSNL